MANVLLHKERAAAIWGSGGRDYDRISEGVSDALTHLVNRIAPQPGERFLDVGTGTGWTARLLSSRGATVTGVDIGAAVIEAAKALAADIDFRVADAEALPFEDASFDAVTSTFGVMFVAQPQTAAQEMVRVCKRGGRLGLVTWEPEGRSQAYSRRCGPIYPHRPRTRHRLRSNGVAPSEFANCSAMHLNCGSRPAPQHCGCLMASQSGSFSSTAMAQQRPSPLASIQSDGST
jgi:SAM-dependent methyltransferase